MLPTTYTLSTTTELAFTDAVERVCDELKAEGFGVLSEIDVQARSVHVPDVRQPSEWRHGHIRGSQNVPLVYLKRRLATLPR
jgi:hypothetical protein